MTEEINNWIDKLVNSGSDSDRKKTDKQLKILKAAVETFAEKGYSASSTSEIAQRAGVAEGTIFRHYKTKKDLLFSIIAPVITQFIAPFVLKDLQPLFEDQFDDFEQFLRAIIANRLEFAMRHQDVIKIFIQEIPFHPELREQFLQYAGHEVMNRYVALIERFQQEGKLVPLPPVAIVRMTLTTVIGYLLIRVVLLPDKPWDDALETEYMVRFMTHGLSLT